ncbi:hypothetical protein [Colwellia sp. TT2012]|uniref:hypothetical protein n=1 Tax=Colwellia sp. TT2012 TaxID=1720342 RepID=UPI000709DFE0|nr:hypothetical protein [Colwellia sp. TT2012]
MFDAETFIFVGYSLSLFGIVIFLIDMFSDKMKVQLQNVTIHIGKLNQQIKELEVIPKDRGYILENEHGSIDIGQSLEILEDAAKEANKNNIELELALLEQIRDSHRKHTRARLAASTFVVIGTVLSFFGGIL